MISIDKNKWSNLKRDFYKRSIAFNEKDIEQIEVLVNKGNKLQNSIDKLNINDFKDYISYIKKIEFLQSLQNDIIIDMWYYNNWFKREYEEKENKKRKREFNRTVARLGA